MADWSVHLLVFCLISIWLLLAFVTAFSLAEPVAFIQWARPLQIISQRIIGGRVESFASLVSGAFAVVSLALLLIVSSCSEAGS